MRDDDLNALKGIKAPPVEAEARRRAIGAGLMAFDAAARAKESSGVPQGTGGRWRLRSIVPPFKGNWIMDTRRLVPAGTAVLALLVALPLAYQLYGTTVLTPPRGPVGTTATDAPVPAEPAPAPAATAAKPAPAARADGAGSGTPPQAPQPEPQAAAELADATPQFAAPAAPPITPAPVAPVASGGAAANAAGGVHSEAAQQLPRADATGAASGAAPAPASVASGAMAREALATAAPKRLAPAPGDSFQKFAESPLKAVATDPVSTFSIDVDTASYAYVRRALNEGRLPQPEAVRIEEMINYFPYDYPAPDSAETPFRPTIAVFPTPWNKATELLRIGIKGYAPPATAQRPANLVFLVDTSGSMAAPDKLPLLQRALRLLVNTLRAEDTVSIVAYAGSAGVVLEPTPASHRATILAALDRLSAGGSTAGAEGIELAYQLAEQHRIEGNNRVILATDGDFNVGISDPEQLKAFIRQKRQDGVALSVLGFGEGNLDDQTMQALAQNGDGNASYIDTLSEAQKVLVKEAGATLDTIARDVKIQVEFNPATVSSYRLIGYETRALNREDFNNDRVDAGDVGAGHAVTALYEITRAGGAGTPPVDPLRYGGAARPAPAEGIAGGGTADELADVKLRYKLPGSDTSRLIEQPVTPAMVASDLAQAPDEARWAAAVAAFGQKLKGSDYSGTMSYADIADLARGARGSDADGYRAEFIRLVGLAGALGGGDGRAAPAAGAR